MNLRPFDAGHADAARLAGFMCSTGAGYEEDVEDWIQTSAIGWANDVPRATFQRRQLAFLEDHDQLVAVVAWQDIVRVDLEGIWLEVLAVGLDDQHGGNGQRVYDVTVDHLRTIDRDGDQLAGLVHLDNTRSQRLLSARSWHEIGRWDDHHALWAGTL